MSDRLRCNKCGKVFNSLKRFSHHLNSHFRDLPDKRVYTKCVSTSVSEDVYLRLLIRKGDTGLSLSSMIRDGVDLYLEGIDD